MDKLYKILLIKAFIPFKGPLKENGEKHWLAKMLDTLETKYQLLLFKGNISLAGSVHLEKFDSILRHAINFPQN